MADPLDAITRTGEPVSRLLPPLSELLPETPGETETPVKPARKPRAPKAAPAPTTLDVLRAQLNAVGALVELQSAKLDALTELLEAQTLLIAKLHERPAASAAPRPSSVPPSGLAKVGARNSSYLCPCLGRDGKPHGKVTVNRFENCPDCYNEAHFQARRAA